MVSWAKTRENRMGHGMSEIVFRNRIAAAVQLANKLKSKKLQNPIVLAIPRGGVVIGAILAKALGAEFDLVLSRKLRAPSQPELAIGAISENGDIYLNSVACEIPGISEAYLAEEKKRQIEEIRRRNQLVRSIRPQATVANRSVIVTDDGIATGSTMIAALKTLRAQKPHELIVAVPVAPPERVKEISQLCDEMVLLATPSHFWAIGQFYEEFLPVEDDEVCRLLKEAMANNRK